MKKLNLKEAPSTIAFTFGRFNPPTIGHEKLLNKLKSVRADDTYIYASHSQNPDKDPLQYTKKIAYMKQSFPKHKKDIVVSRARTVFEVVVEIQKKYNPASAEFLSLVMVVGSDRVKEFKTLLNTYNGIESRHGYYKFKNIKVISAGERDPDAEGATGMSASKMRAAVSSKDFTSFKRGLPTSFGDSIPLYKAVAKGMKVSLAAGVGSVGHHVGYEFKPVASLEEFEQKQIRDLYIREMIFNVGDKVNYVVEDINGEVKRRGTNYIVIEDNNNNLHKCWIWDCIPESGNREVEMREYDLNVDYGFEAVNERKQPQDKDVEKEPGTQPKKYYKDLKKDTKQKRSKFS